MPDVLFSDAAQAILDGHIVYASYGVKLELTTETLYLTQGDSFVDNVGQRWDGLGLLGQISGVQVGPEAATSPLQMTLSGIVEDDKTRAQLYPTLFAAARDSNAEIRGGVASVYIHLFDSTTGRAIDMPYLAQIYELDNATFAYDGESGSVTISVPGDPLFGGKHIAPLNMVTDADQQAKYPNDRIFERVGYKHQVVTQA